MLLSDCLWYLGHILTGVAIIVNHYSFSLGITTVAIGQFITIISRPIGRINNAKFNNSCSEMREVRV
jgi:hypothetical protein